MRTLKPVFTRQAPADAFPTLRFRSHRCGKVRFDKVRNVRVDLLLVGLVEDLMPAALVAFEGDVLDADSAVKICQLAGQPAEVAKGIVSAADDEDRHIAPDPVAVLLLIELGSVSEQGIVKAGREGLRVVGILAVLVEAGLVPRQPVAPVEVLGIGPEGELLNQLGTALFPAEYALQLGDDQPGPVGQTVEVLRAADNCAVCILTTLEVALTENRTVAVAEHEQGQAGIFFP